MLFPSYQGRDMGALHPPLGLGYLAEVLEAAGVECQVVDMRLGYPLTQVLKKIRWFQPELVGVSVMTLLYRRTHQLVREIKRACPNVALGVGGPHVSTFDKQLMEEWPEVDFGFVQEAEESLVQLCAGQELSSIKGVMYRKDGQVISTGPGEFISNLDQIPFPRFKNFELNQYITREMGILTSRGCPYRCTYCPVATVVGKHFRVRSSKHVVEEICYWYERGYRQFDILDDVFNREKGRVLEICDALQRLKLKGLEFKCGNGIRADHLDREVLSRMRQVGFKHIAIGVEGGNDRVLRLMKKGQSIDTVKRAIELACQLGFDVTLFFIVGSQGETWQDVEDSVNLALSYPVFDARFYNIIPFPRTELFDWVDNNNLFLIKPEEYLNEVAHFDHAPIFATTDFPAEERKRALAYTARVRKEVRIRAMKRKLRRLGLLGSLLARLYTLDLVQERLLHHRWIRINARKLYDLVSAN